MVRRAGIVLGMLLVGCQWETDPAPIVCVPEAPPPILSRNPPLGPTSSFPLEETSSPVNEPAVEASQSAFRFDEEKRVIYLDTRAPAPQRQQFFLGLGSITLETREVANGQLTLRYTPEVEGGYSVYEFHVPVSDTPLEFAIARDGTPGPTSLDLNTGTVIEQGNLLLGQVEKKE